MAEKIMMTINDYQRIHGLMEFASLGEKMPEIVTQLNRKFSRTKMLPQDRILASVVTMNSRVLLKEITHSRHAEVTITYPQDADGRKGKISVFSSIGAALLGCQVGDNVSWKTPAGTGHFQIMKIIYQPEAVGHYHL